MRRTLEQIGLEGSVCVLPDGTEVLVYPGDDGGYILYTRPEWRDCDNADYEAEQDEQITFQGQPTPWTLADLRRVGDGSACEDCGEPVWPRSGEIDHNPGCPAVSTWPPR